MSRELANRTAWWRNPVFVRFRRSRLRWRRAIFWYLLTVIVATFVVTLTFTLKVNGGASPASAARDIWIPLLIIQGAILMVKGTGAVSAGLIQDRLDGTLDYQRLTPMSPLANVTGYLFGLPVLEYVMAALTLPHVAFIAVVGDLPLGTLASVYLAFLICVVLYHTTAIAVSMVMKRWIVGYVLSIAMVLTVNVVLPTFISQFGLRFFQFLSVWPVIGQKVLPLTVSPAALDVALQNPWFATAGDVPFYDLTISAFSFTLMMQGSLILTFGLMAMRRWRSEQRHSLSKPYALAFLIGFLTVLLGNVWPAITGRYLPFPIFGQTDIAQMTEVIAVGFPVVYALVTWLLCLSLFAIVVPDHHAFLRGLRRARKVGRLAQSPWADDAAGLAFMSLFTAAVLLGFWALFHSLTDAGLVAALAEPAPALWRLPLALGLVLVYSLILIQVVELKATALVVLLLWLLPILAAIVLSSITQSVASLHAVVASLSPLALLLMAGAAPLNDNVPAASAGQFGILLTGVNSGIACIIVQIAVLAIAWRRLTERFARLAETTG